jgi:hypothetical protein
LSKEHEKAIISVYTMDGKIIQSYTINSRKGNGSIRMDLSKLGSGTYLYSLIVNKKLIDTKKMQVLK